MDVVALVRTFLAEYGLLTGMTALALVVYLVLRERASKSSSEDAAAQAAAAQAHTAQQNLITRQFESLYADNRALLKRVDTLEDAQAADAAQIAASNRRVAEMEAELKSALDRARLLELDVKTLTEKVAALETEKAVRAGELERERAQGQTLTRSLKAATDQIAQLKDRVSRLEGENTALKLLLEKLQVIAVTEPPPATEVPVLLVAPEISEA